MCLCLKGKIFYQALILFSCLQTLLPLILFFTLYDDSEILFRILNSFLISLPLSVLASIIFFFISYTKKKREEISEVEKEEIMGEVVVVVEEIL